MTNINLIFLAALRAALKNESYTVPENTALEEWNSLYQLAAKHSVLPLVHNAVYQSLQAGFMQEGRSNEERAALQAVFMQVKNETMRSVMMQTMKTSLFLGLYKEFAEAGIHPIVVKGLICRNLYPNPDFRPSGDEDIWIDPAQFEAADEVMHNYGMALLEPGQDTESAYEVPYAKVGTPLYIEMHKYLFPPKSEAYGNLNQYFVNARKNAITVTAEDVEVSTMCETDHLFYLICHAFKHFLHSGFGIRQVCDIVLFAETNGRKIEWELLLHNAKEIKADLFTASLFKIGYQYLGMDFSNTYITEEWLELIDTADEEDILNDLLDAGVYGDGSMSRRHSSNMTLNAVASDKKGEKVNEASVNSGVLKSLFPSAKDLSGRYPYLSDKPFLLPVAWVDRIVHYAKETSGAKGSSNSAAESVKIGKQRVDLFEKYGIINREENPDAKEKK